jgi:hypothetical protein
VKSYGALDRRVVGVIGDAEVGDDSSEATAGAAETNRGWDKPGPLTGVEVGVPPVPQVRLPL